MNTITTALRRVGKSVSESVRVFVCVCECV